MTNIHGFQLAWTQPDEEQDTENQDTRGMMQEIEFLSAEVSRLRDKVLQYQTEHEKTVRAQLLMDALLAIGIGFLTFVLFRI